MSAAANDEPLDFGVDPFDRTFGQLRGPIHWPSLTAPESASRMSELRDWVRLLVTRFGDRHDPRARTDAGYRFILYTAVGSTSTMMLSASGSSAWTEP